MGWEFCGKRRNGDDIGYGVPAKCEHPGCSKEIDRGIAHACGGTHGDTEISCDKYFCAEHLVFCPVSAMFVCEECAEINARLEKESTTISEVEK